MIADLSEVRRTLQPDPESTSIRRVCDAVEELLAQSRSAGGPKQTANV